MKLINYPSPNFDERAQDSMIDKLVLHYTGMQNLETSLARMIDSSSKVSSHYLIDEVGLVYQLVNEDKRAWHRHIPARARSGLCRHRLPPVVLRLLPEGRAEHCGRLLGVVPRVVLDRAGARAGP